MPFDSQRQVIKLESQGQFCQMPGCQRIIKMRIFRVFRTEVILFSNTRSIEGCLSRIIHIFNISGLPGEKNKNASANQFCNAWLIQPTFPLIEDNMATGLN
jgi:hypothetical protein